MSITVGSSTITVNSGAVMADPPGTAGLFFARAWVNYLGAGTVSILGSGNVTSMTDNGVGDYTMNFTTAMPNVNYAAVCGFWTNGGGGVMGGQSATYAEGSFRNTIRAYDNTAGEALYSQITIFR